MRFPPLGFSTLLCVPLLALAAQAPTELPLPARKAPRPNIPAGGVGVSDVQMLVPGFAVRMLPLELPNINAVRYRADGKLLALTFSGKVFLLTDTDGDGVEDKADIFYEPDRQHLSLNLLPTPPGYRHGNGVFIARKGSLVLELDTDGDDRADREVTVATNWETPMRFPGNATDTVGVALDAQQNLYFGLGAANSQNGYLLDHGVGSYRITSERGALLKMPPDLSRREIIATGIRAGFGMAFNAAGDLFSTDQEGATWMPNGNPFDELLHLEPGRHYGFPPRHPKHLPHVIDEPSVFDYGPQHQSTCGLFFNEPVGSGPVFGPAWWRGDAFVAGEARGKVFRTKLVKTPSGYIGQNQVIACVGWLTIDQCVSPRGDLVISVHSGPPDWGTGGPGIGRLFKVTRADAAAPQPVSTFAASPTELHVAFDGALPPGIETNLVVRTTLTSGVYVREGDRFETFRPGYRAVDQQQSAPRTRVPVRAVRLADDRHTLVFETVPRTIAQHTSIDIDNWLQAPTALAKVRPQKAALAVAADETGVAATWRSTDRRTTWTGWLPHFDLQVARELTAASVSHQRLWSLVRQPGTLVLRGQLDLWSMLRPAVQPGERLDFTLPAEKVTVRFAANGGAAPQLTFPGLAPSPATDTTGNMARLLRHVPRERTYVPVELTVATGSGQTASLHVSWTTAEDDRPRALALRRVIVPWASPPEPVTKPAMPAELAGGDWHKGKQLFAACAMCHGVNGEGSRVGPDLSNLVHRDYASVVRDIAEPSAAINPDHVAYTITLRSGETQTSVLLEDNADHLLLAVPGSTPKKLPKSDIIRMSASAVSLMPPGLDQALGPQGLRDLLSYLMLPSPDQPSNSTP
ncbi:MAG: c-type cytochrome [Opitutaceae bacterium]|nr:c-type cytochrome [Opitutaceae bacterium]